MVKKFYLDVALPVPIRKTFIYLPIDGSDVASYNIGSRVEVSFGTRKLIGIIYNILSDISQKMDSDKITLAQLKKVNKILDTENILSITILDLINFAANYYHHPLGEIVSASMPKTIRQGKDLEIISNKLVLLNTDSNFLLQNKNLSKPQVKLIKLLAENNNSLSLFSLNHLGIKQATIDSLQNNNWLKIINKKSADKISTNSNGFIKKQELILNQEQAYAVDKISNKLDCFSCFLLYGITGSGKTEIYLQVINKVLHGNKQVLVLVPEISLTPQTVSRFKDRFNTKIAVIHSKISHVTKTHDWLAARNNEAKIIIGTRSAILVPIADLGLIIIDEEHDGSFKQQDGFRYNGRDLAIIRAQKNNIPIILGSATPSIESIANAINKKYEFLELKQRAGGAKLPSIKLLNTKQKKLSSGLSLELLNLIKSKLNNNQQVLIFLNRRGYAPVVKCNDCSWGGICQRCNVYYTLHKQDGVLICHYCDSTKRLMSACPDCGSVDLTSFGVGTEQVEQYLLQFFDKYKTIRIDRDTTKNKHGIEKQLKLINHDEPLILLGTQMLAKGHHFPNVTLVAILDVDNSLFSTDFRAPEKITQLILQVAGRAGRSDKPSEVVIQTNQPEHKLLQDILYKDYWTIAKELYQIRQQALQPPCSYWVLIRAESYDLSKTMRFLKDIRSFANEIDYDKNFIKILGPILAPRVKKAGMLRGQLLLSSSNRKELHMFIDKLLDKISELKTSSIRWSLDVDPQDIY